nr:unnamed protein product [Amyelois transitella]
MFPSVEKWLLIQWSDNDISVVHIRSLTNMQTEALHPGEQVTAIIKGESKVGTFICKTNDRQMLLEIQQKMKAEIGAGPSGEGKKEGEPQDFSPSGSSWQPSDDHASDSDEVAVKKVKTEHVKKQFTFEKPKRILTPSNKANAVIPDAMRGNNSIKKTPINKKRPNVSTNQTNENKSKPDSTKKNIIQKVIVKKGTLNFETILGLRCCFRDLFGMVKGMTIHSAAPDGSDDPVKTEPNVSKAIPNMTCDDDKENEKSHSAESSRSEDNVLISNKYKNYNEISKKTNAKKSPPPRNIIDGEWVSIGSGKTLLHKDKFMKVNWKSYTVATRTLLMALFPRRILATHSLTGKRSPAFQNKPAKMCLDPKIISDVIMEIQDRFNVKENLIRSIITTKCADECKMFKMRQDKRKALAPVSKQEKVDNKKVPEEEKNDKAVTEATTN